MQNQRWERTASDDATNGNKRDFRKVTITLPPDAYERLIRESARRKIAGEPNQLLSSLLREAVDDYLNLIEGRRS